MHPAKAQVRSGRLIVVEPTDLPEGKLVEPVPLDELLAHGGDELDDVLKLKRRHDTAKHLRGVSPSELHVCAITWAEARAGALRSANPERVLAACDLFLQPFENRILPFYKEAAEAYGEIRARLEAQGNMIGDRDCMMPSTPHSSGYTARSTCPPR